MIVVTGGYGFIGSATTRLLLATGRRVLVVDDLTDGSKLANLADVQLAHYLDREEFHQLLACDDTSLATIEAVIHLGAISDTSAADGKVVFEFNYRSSRALLDFCTAHAIPLIYASSASVYGRTGVFREEPACERPLNPYAHSKLVFDNLVREHHGSAPSANTLGLRFFNVYGPGEDHKGAMASVVRHFDTQARTNGVIRPFGASHGYEAGQQERDFVYVDDVVQVIEWALRASEAGRDVNGIVNVGTGSARTFHEIAELVQRSHPGSTIEYRDFPDQLAERYQPHTCADLSRLRELGYGGAFRPIEDGVAQYLEWLHRDRA